MKSASFATEAEGARKAPAAVPATDPPADPLDLRGRNGQHHPVRLRAHKASLLAIGLLFAAALYLWISRDPGYRVVAHDRRYSVSAFKLSRGHDHYMWDADPAEITFSRWLGSTSFTRRIRFKLLSPISWFRTRTTEPSLAFIVRLKGEMSDADFAGLTARVVSGTNSYELQAQASQRNFARRSLIKCWTMQSTPPTNAPVELHVSFASGAGLGRIAIPTDRTEFAHPLIAKDERKSYVAGILDSFLRGEKPAKETLQVLHELYEEYGAPDFLTAFEMLYYDPDGSVAGDVTETLRARLESGAREWLKTTNLK